MPFTAILAPKLPKVNMLILMMNMMTMMMLVIAMAAPARAADSAASKEAPPPVEAGRAIRVGGSMEAKLEQRGDVFTSGSASINTPLPQGYPPPTPPGAIEIKQYPLVRRAQVSSTGGMDAGMNAAFWPLFRHIQSREIEMTTPVEMNYKGLEPRQEDRPDSWTMSFLYRRVDQGPLGPDGKLVEVVDVPPVTVAALGYQGDYSLELVRLRLKQLTLWLEQNEATWEPAGEPRSMFYNGPDVHPPFLWAEVQVPVRLRHGAVFPPAPAQTGAPAEPAKPDPVATPTP